MNAEPTKRGPVSDLNPPSRLAPVIERAPLPMVEVDGADHVVRFVNSAFCALVGRTADALVGKPFAAVVCGDPKCVELLDRVYQTGQAETHASPDHETPAYWLFAMWPALDESDRPERVVIQMTKAAQYRADLVALNEALLLGSVQQHELRENAEKSNANLQAEIAERRRVEAALKAAQEQLRATADQLERMVVERTAQLQASVGDLEAFAYSLAHDLRAPVRTMHGFTELVLEMPKGDVSPPAIEFLQRVLAAATRMDSLIQDVLTLTNVIRRPVLLVPVDVEALVCSMVHERPELWPERADISVLSPLIPVVGHEALLSQCLTNLLSNAVKFVEPGAVPTVRVRTERLSNATDTPGSSLVRIWIEDEGIGIPAEARERIFEIFQRLHSTSQYDGTGIGLSIVRKAMERMGGRVGVESAESKGSRFWLELPAA